VSSIHRIRNPSSRSTEVALLAVGNHQCAIDRRRFLTVGARKRLVLDALLLSLEQRNDAEGGSVGAEETDTVNSRKQSASANHR